MGGEVLELQSDRVEREGYEIGRDMGIKAIVELWQETSKEKLSLLLIRKFNITEAEAQDYIKKFWKE